MPAFKRLLSWGSQLTLPVRIISSILLIVLLFIATMHNEQIYAVISSLWQKVFLSDALAQHPTPPLQSEGIVGQLTHRPRNIPAVVIYSFLYTVTCVALLFIILLYPQQRRLVLISYGFALSLVIFLVLASVIGGNTLRILNTQLIHFIVSPMPVIILAPLLWKYSSPNNKN